MQVLSETTRSHSCIVLFVTASRLDGLTVAGDGVRSEVDNTLKPDLKTDSSVERIDVLNMHE